MIGKELVLTWIGIALSFAGLLAWAEGSRSAMDDADAAYQRTGTLLPAASLPAPPNLLGEYPRPGHRLAVIFARSVNDQLVFHDLAFQSDLSVLADLVLVTEDGEPPVIENGFNAVMADPDGTIVRAFGLRTPIDGGYPVGYALVDRSGFIRHQTLDPHCIGMGHNLEIKALLKAMP